MLDTIYTLVVLICALVGTIIPLGIKLYYACRKAKNSKTEEEKASARLELENITKELMLKAEEFYNNFKVMQASGIYKTGALKKDYVLEKVENYCIKNGLEVDQEEVSLLVENLMTFAKGVTNKNE